MHSSRMCTAHSLTGVKDTLGVSAQGGVCPGVFAQGGVCPAGCHVTYPIIHLLSLHQLRLITSAGAYIVFGHMTCDACWKHPPRPDRMTDMCKNITSFAGGNESDSLHFVITESVLCHKIFLFHSFSTSLTFLI